VESPPGDPRNLGYSRGTHAARDRLRLVRAVAVLAQGRERHGDGPSARIRTLTASGRWLVPHGCRVGGHLAVVIEVARPAELAPIIMLAYGLSLREREVTSLVLHGMSTQDIARRLHLSPYTIQDHLEAIFEKVGVRSRRELAGQIFQEQFWPRFQTEERGDVSTGDYAGLRPQT